MGEELFDIGNARNVHLAWEWELEAIARGQKEATDLASYEDCQLGRWLHGTGLRKYKETEHIHQLVDVHQRFHAVAHRILTGMKNAQFDSVEQDLKRVRILSQEIIFTLTAIEFSALKQQRSFSGLPGPLRKVLQQMFDTDSKEVASSPMVLEAGEARLTHFRWSQDLLSAFRNRGRGIVLKPAESCALGLWIHTVGLRKHADLSDMHRLDQAHKAFHQKAALSVRAIKNSHGQQADRAYEEMLRYSLEVVYLLTTIENRLIHTDSLAPRLMIHG